MISQAKCSTRLVADGALIVQAEYTIQHQSPLNWRLRLPAMDEMLACEINEHPAQPVQRANNEIEFFLATPVGETRVE